MSTTPPRVQARLDSLTGLRFFAAFVVFAFHSLHYGQQSLGDAFFLAGTTGVSFFFVVSGLVMSWTARPTDTAGTFYRRRFARIYPAYAVAWLVSLGIMLAQGRSPSLLDLLPLTLAQAWFPSDTVYWATNAVFWSLSCEAFFYLAFPLLYRVLSPLSPRRMLFVVAGLVAVVVGWSIGVAPWWGEPAVYWFVSVFPLTRLAEFTICMLMGLLLRAGLRWIIPLWAATAIAVGAFLAANHVPEVFAGIAVTLVPFVVLIWSAAQADLAGRRSIFRARVLVVLGTWSYAFYLAHTQAMTAWFEALQRLGVDKDTVQGPGLFLAVCGAFGCALVAAWSLHRLVEVPMERRLRPRAAGPSSLLNETPVRSDGASAPDRPTGPRPALAGVTDAAIPPRAGEAPADEPQPVRDDG